ncbi:MAG TPA: bifunctional riboflavin kinase/FAD synthetase [Flavobacteriaceae bacterium]|nr:bifunctional riboflavin kinase/FAD synthetase [Flavobacteriaceae bacterium]
MKVYHSIETFDVQSPVAITIGTFDGVHLGHKEILNQLKEIAKQAKLPSVVLTFFPHPRMVLDQIQDVKMLNTIEERIEILSRCGIDHVIVYPFSKEFSQLTASEYIEGILLEKIKAQKIIIGYDHRFGKNREAGIETLLDFKKKYPALEVIEIPVQLLNSTAVSSTKTRQALQEGNVSLANEFLGYAYMLSGTVVQGKGIGKTLGYPTANLHIAESYKLIPANGIYVVQCEIEGAKTFGMTSIGNNPTVGGTERTIETFFLDFAGDLYGKTLRIEFLEKIREEAKFDSIESLQKAIHKDEIFARNYLKQYA